MNISDACDILSRELKAAYWRRSISGDVRVASGRAHSSGRFVSPEPAHGEQRRARKSKCARKCGKTAGWGCLLLHRETASMKSGEICQSRNLIASSERPARASFSEHEKPAQGDALEWPTSPLTCSVLQYCLSKLPSVTDSQATAPQDRRLRTSCVPDTFAVKHGHISHAAVIPTNRDLQLATCNAVLSRRLPDLAATPPADDS